ncbi:MAG TPA: hypothetical protein VN734_13310 [Acidobacteriaceae bacterium]|nr:hypothetical protein [Acidobacteriaceae bacterium]
MQIGEVRRRQSELAAVIGDAVEDLDLSQEVIFTQYTRKVLPLDGYVFWIPTGTLTVPGALHVAMEMIQNEDETFGLASATFTTQTFVAEFTDIPVSTIYVATVGESNYAFSRHAGYFQAANTWHYQGSSIPPALLSQLLSSPSQLPTGLIVSNSLPIWLAFNGYKSPYVGGFSNTITLFPSKLVPTNEPAPYGVVHIEPANTRGISGVPQVQQVSVNGVATRVMTQLMADRVKIVLYGLQSDAAQEFYGALMEYIGTTSTNGMGLMNVPALQDGKREQVELQTIAMQKTMDIDVSYSSYYAKSVALQTIKTATMTWVGFNTSV